MTIEQYVALFGGAAGVLGMLNSLRKTRIDDRAGAVDGLHILCEQLQTQLDSTVTRAKAREAELQASIEEIKTELTQSRARWEQQLAMLTAKLSAQRDTIEQQALQLRQLGKQQTRNGTAGGL